MARKVRFIHAADIHLGAPISGLLDVSPEWSSLLQQAIANAWERVVNAAITREVDFVVIAGDLFDTSRPSYGDFLRLFQGLERLHEEGIPAYLVTGNHDPYTLWERETSRLPPTATLLGVNGPEFALFARDGEPLCLVGGRSYYHQAWPEGESIASGIGRAQAVKALSAPMAHQLGRRDAVPAPASAPFMVGVVHTGLTRDQSKAATNLKDLLAADVDYWACGHLHESLVAPPVKGFNAPSACFRPAAGGSQGAPVEYTLKESAFHPFSENDADALSARETVTPKVVFPGCVQGRNIDEQGERGCFLVELEEASVGQPCRTSLEFVPTSSVVFQQLTVNVGACQTLADIRRLVQTELFHENGKAHCDEMVARITLAGATPLHEYLVKPEVMADLRQHINNAYPSFYCDALVDKTCMQGDALSGGPESTDATLDGGTATSSLRAEKGAGGFRGVEGPAAGGMTGEAAGATYAATAEAGIAAGLFPDIVAAIAEDQRQRADVLVNFVQDEFVKRGIAVPSTLAESVLEFNDDAERLVIDLLRSGES